MPAPGRLNPLVMQQRAREGHRLFGEGRTREALAIYRELHALVPDHPGVNTMLGMCLAAIANHKAALVPLERAYAAGVRAPDLITTLAVSLRNLGRFQDAERVLDDLLAKQPGDPGALAAKSDLYFFIGQPERAIGVLEPGLKANPRDHGLILAYCRAATTEAQRLRAVELSRSVEQDADLPARRRALLHFRTGPHLDKLKRYDEAFEAFRKGHTIVREAWDPVAHRALVGEVIAKWTAEAVSAIQPARQDSPRPVFIVGMPRSGTTLIEQIIDAHPKAFGAGELQLVHGMVFEMTRTPYLVDPSGLKRPVLERLGARYLGATAELAPRDAERVTDKAPLNFRNVGLISLMFPGAKIIHARRDARDTCLSCYFQWLAGYFPQGHDLEHLGRFHVDHDRLMDHWKRVFPGRILDVRYEDVVDDLEGQTRRLLDFIGLEFDPRCLRFWETGRVATTSSNDQVRQPLYKSSVARHERYAAHIAPLIRGLEAP